MKTHYRLRLTFLKTQKQNSLEKNIFFLSRKKISHMPQSIKEVDLIDENDNWRIHDLYANE